VSFVNDDPSFWGCGECGSLWYERSNLFSEIEKMIQTFPYRKKCYRKVGDVWLPAEIGEGPKGYSRMVENEPENDLDTYVRG
jgi:hypothetical protein